MSGYAFHFEAILDLEEVWEYIARDSREAADRVSDEILSAIGAMVSLPHQGHRRPDLTRRPLRFLLVREYLIAYAPDEMPVWILAIVHGRRNPRLIAAMLDQRGIH